MLLHEVLSTVTETVSAAPVVSTTAPYWWAQPAATVTGGIIVGIGALLGFKASTESRKSSERMARITDLRERENADRVHGREVMSARQNRYTTIAEQLSSMYEPVRLAGIYALSALADDWHDAGDEAQRNSAIELLCAYLRAEPRDGNDKEVRAAATAVIRDHTHRRTLRRWPGALINLSGAQLSGVDLSETDLRHADLSDGSWELVNLHGADLRCANIIYTKMISTHMSKVDLSGCEMMDNEFIWCEMRESNMEDCRMWKVKFEGTILRQANFTNSIMGEPKDSFSTVFESSNLAGANFSGVDMKAVDFGSADDGTESKLVDSRTWQLQDGTDKWNLTIVRWDGETRWPRDYNVRDTLARQLEGVNPPDLPTRLGNDGSQRTDAISAVSALASEAP